MWHCGLEWLLGWSQGDLSPGRRRPLHEEPAGDSGSKDRGTSSSILLGDVWLGTESGATPLLDSAHLVAPAQTRRGPHFICTDGEVAWLAQEPQTEGNEGMKAHPPGRQWRSVSVSASLKTNKQPSFLIRHRLQQSPDPALPPGHVLSTGHCFSLVLASCSTVRAMAVAGSLYVPSTVGCTFVPHSCLTVALATSCGTIWHVGSAGHVENWSEKTD